MNQFFKKEWVWVFTWWGAGRACACSVQWGGGGCGGGHSRGRPNGVEAMGVGVKTWRKHWCRRLVEVLHKITKQQAYCRWWLAGLWTYHGHWSYLRTGLAPRWESRWKESGKSFPQTFASPCLVRPFQASLWNVLIFLRFSYIPGINGM